MDGAKAIALPTRKGQSLDCKPGKGSDIYWSSLDHLGKAWFSSQISIFDFSPIKTSDKEISASLQKLLKNAVRLNSEFLSKWNGFKVETKLEFDKEWGLGSSSSLTYLVAQWADVHPLLLHFKTYNGSGYDVACAGADGPITYQLANDEVNWEEIDFEPSFYTHLFFIYLGNKQSSADGIKFYSQKVKDKKSFVKECNSITSAILECKDLKSFMKLMNDHEKLVAKTLDIEAVKGKLFSDFNGSIKSLGAWGGDFVLAASDMSPQDITNYFASKGYNQCFAYKDFVL